VSVSFVNAGTEGAAGSGPTVTPGSPSSPVAGDVWIMACYHAADLTPSAHADWTLIGSYNPGAQASRLTLWYFRYASAAPTDNVITTSSSTANRTSGIAAFRGCIASGSPVGGSTVETEWGVVQLQLFEALPAASAPMGSMLLRVIGYSNDEALVVLPDGTTAAFEDSSGGTQNVFMDSTGSPDSSVGLSYAVKEMPGAVGRDWSVTAGNILWVTASLALLPEPTHEVAGVTRDSDGDPLGSCDVHLLHYLSDVFTFIAHTTSHSSTGAYSFPICPASSGAYAVVARKEGSPNVFDVTDFTLTPVAL